MPTLTYCPRTRRAVFNSTGANMPKETHAKAAEHHENAAKAHRTAAEHHGKGEHDRGTKRRQRPTNILRRLIVTQPTPTGRAANTERRNNPRFPGAAMPRPSGSDFSVNRSLLHRRLPKTPIALAIGHGSDPKHPRGRLKFGYGSTPIGTTPRGDPRSRC